ncbi:hypothetical protein ACLOJK_026266 [Asimina triloba]
MNDKGEQGSSSGRFHILQPNRDLESNWDVDLAKKLEEYLLKICSGEIAAADEVYGHTSVNFAEAALLIQGSIQVYSRKVEYLYSLVLHALRFISQRSQDQPEETTVQPDGTGSLLVVDGEDENFLGLDHVPVEAKNCLDDGPGKDDALNHFVKPPSNLLVLEGDCLDTSGGGGGELESYLLATSGLYQDFLLLDPCDAAAVDDFLGGNDADLGHNVVHGGSTTQFRARKSFPPSPRSKGSAHKSNLGKSPHRNQQQTEGVTCDFNDNHNEDNAWHGTDIPKENMYHAEDMDGGFFEPRDDSDDDDQDDPWKPLNPHEPGNLKVKPFRKGRNCGRQRVKSSKQSSIAVQFPLARLEGTISPEFAESLESEVHNHEEQCDPKSPPLYEKLRKSLMLGENETSRVSENLMDENEDHDFNNDFPDFEEADVGFDDHALMDAEVLLPHDKTNDDDDARFDATGAFGQDDPSSQASLDDLCRSHLKFITKPDIDNQIDIDVEIASITLLEIDVEIVWPHIHKDDFWFSLMVGSRCGTRQYALPYPCPYELSEAVNFAALLLDALLATIAETEKQTELAARVSTWKQRIENVLEEQDSQPPFDIHAYGERILDKLTLEADREGCMSFAHVVAGQAKPDVARTFSAMLQLVNNGNISLDREESGGESICYTATNPFHVRLLDQGKRQGGVQFHSSKKHAKSPSRKRFYKGQENRPPVEIAAVCSSSPGKSSSSNGKFSVKLSKATVISRTPEGKRRRRTRPIIEPVNLQPVG